LLDPLRAVGVVILVLIAVIGLTVLAGIPPVLGFFVVMAIIIARN
jgi:hypothetical protein